MQKAKLSGEVELQTVPGGMTIEFGANQVSLTYNGETSVIEVDDDGFFVSGSENIAPAHTGDMMNLLKGAYESHREWCNECLDE